MVEGNGKKKGEVVVNLPVAEPVRKYATID